MKLVGFMEPARQKSIYYDHFYRADSMAGLVWESF